MLSLKQKLLEEEQENQRKILLKLDNIESSLNKLLPNKENERLSVEEVANELSVAKLTVYNWIKKGMLPADKIGRKFYIKRSELIKALKQYKTLKYRR